MLNHSRHAWQKGFLYYFFKVAIRDHETEPPILKYNTEKHELNRLTAKSAKCGVRTVMVLSFVAFEPRYCASYWHSCRGSPCSLSPLPAYVTSAISLTGSYLCDLGGADLLTTSWRVGPFSAVSILPRLSYERRVYAIYRADRERYLRFI